MISVAINTPSADLFALRELGTANGWVGSTGWADGLLFSLVTGQLVQVTGYGPPFACLSIFDIAGAIVLVVLLRSVTQVEEIA